MSEYPVFLECVHYERYDALLLFAMVEMLLVRS